MNVNKLFEFFQNVDVLETNSAKNFFLLNEKNDNYTHYIYDLFCDFFYAPKIKEKSVKSLWVVFFIVFCISVLSIIAYAFYMLALDEYNKDEALRTQKAGFPSLWVYSFMALIFIALQVYILVAVVECDEQFMNCLPAYYVLAFLGAILVAWLLFSKKLTVGHMIGIAFVILGIIIYLIY